MFRELKNYCREDFIRIFGRENKRVFLFPIVLGVSPSGSLTLFKPCLGAFVAGIFTFCLITLVEGVLKFFWRRLLQAFLHFV